ncbi:MAG: WecB/TagA/CpsF family glycosyltransferase [Ignavibacteriales bacterium]
MTIQNETTTLLGCKIDLVNMEGALTAIEDAISQRQPSQVVTLNAEMIYVAQKDQALREVYSRARLVTADGIGVVWALRHIGHSNVERVTGIDLTTELLNKAAGNGWKLFLFGAKPGVVDSLAAILSQRYPGLIIAGTQHGYFKEADSPEIVAQIKACNADILLVALGAPKQDFWISEYLGDMMVPVCIGVGGTFDVLSGRAERAPAVWQRLGMEWLYRLLKEPSRWRRQLALPKFAWMVILHGKKSS